MATGHQSFRDVTVEDLDTGMMVGILKQVGTAEKETERLKMFMNTPTSWAAHNLRKQTEIPSEPAPYGTVTCLKPFHTFSSDIVSNRASNVFNSSNREAVVYGEKIASKDLCVRST